MREGCPCQELVLIRQRLLCTGGSGWWRLPGTAGLAPPGPGALLMHSPSGSSSRDSPTPSITIRPSPSSPHSTAPGCEVSSPWPAPDPAGAPIPSVFTILALLPQCQKPSHSSCLSLVFSLWKTHGCCAWFSSQGCRLLRLQGPCSARVQPHREDMAFPLALTAAVYEKPSFLHSCIALRPGNAGFCPSQTNPGTPLLWIQLLNLMQSNLHIYQAKIGK